MSSSVNKAIIVGHLGSAPEVRSTSSGSRLARFSIATNDRWRDRDQNVVEKTEWHKIVIFGPKAEVAEQYLKKGSLIMIEGAIRSHKWTDKDGNERETVEIHVTQFDGDFTMLGSKGQGASEPDGNTGQGNPAPQPKAQNKPDIEDPPF